MTTKEVSRKQERQSTWGKNSGLKKAGTKQILCAYTEKVRNVTRKGKYWRGVERTIDEEDQ